jgi:hypothetical protein
MEKKLNSTRHRDAIPLRRPKSPVAGGLDRGAVEERLHAMNQRNPGDVPFPVDIDLHRNVAAQAVWKARRIGRLLLFENRWRLDCRRRRPGLRTGSGLKPNQRGNGNRRAQQIT